MAVATLERPQQISLSTESLHGHFPDYSRLPLSDILQPPHLRGKPEAFKFTVAKHESKHMFAALEYGVPIHSVSCEPEGNAAGVTKLLGHVPIEVMQIIAAASMHSDQNYTPVGFGSDLQKVRLGAYWGGTTEGDAKDKAFKAVGGIPEKLFARVSEIIAIMGYVSGENIPAVIARAQAELDIEAKLTGEKYEETYDSTPNKRFVEPTISEIAGRESPDDKQETTEIIDTANGDKKVVWKMGNKVIRTETMCQSCGGIGDHMADCPTLKLKKRNLGDENFSIAA